MKAVTIMSNKPSTWNEEPAGRITWDQMILAVVIAACLAWLVAGVSIRIGSVDPASRLVLSEQAKSLAKELDAALKIRAVAIVSAAYNKPLERLLASSGLENFTNTIRSQFTDFLSLEVLNGNGEAVAMMGDLPLSQAGLSPKDAGENVFLNDSRAFLTGVFRDDPANECFFLTCRHRNEDGTYWFTRTRFSRRVVEALLSEFQGRASLVSISGGKNDLAMVYGHPTRIYGNWWAGPQSVEASLETPGWLLKLSADDQRSLFKRASFILPAVIMVFAALAYLFGSRIRSREHWNRGAEVACLADASAGRESVTTASQSGEMSRGAAGIKPQPKNRIRQQELPNHTGLFTINVAPGYHPPQEQVAASKTDEASDDYFCPPQLIFDPGTDELASLKASASEAERKTSLSGAPKIEAIESLPAEFRAENPDRYAEFIVHADPQEIQITESLNEFSPSEEQLYVTREDVLPEDVDFFWEEEADSSGMHDAAMVQSQAKSAVATYELAGEVIPDVLVLEWEEPATKPVAEKKKEQPREVVLFSEFFNC